MAALPIFLFLKNSMQTESSQMILNCLVSEFSSELFRQESCLSSEFSSDMTISFYSPELSSQNSF